MTEQPDLAGRVPRSADSGHEVVGEAVVEQVELAPLPEAVNEILAQNGAAESAARPGADVVAQNGAADSAAQPGADAEPVSGEASQVIVDADGNPIKDRRKPKSVRRPANPRVSVVVPALNEARNVREILPYLADYHEVILVDGHSVDGTVAAAREALPGVKIIEQTRQGKGNALACGFEAATGEVIVMFDVDGSADPNEIPDFIKALEEGADLAKGSRFTKGGGSEDITLFRRIGNMGLNLLASALTEHWFTDLCYGYNAFWSDQLYKLDLPDTKAKADKLMLPGDGFEIEALIIGRFALSGAKITEVPSFEHDRYYGDSNLNAVRDGIRVLRTILQDRAYARRIRTLARRRGATNLPPPERPGWMRD